MLQSLVGICLHENIVMMSFARASNWVKDTSFFDDFDFANWFNVIFVKLPELYLTL